MRESTYQAKLIGKIKKMFPGCIAIKNDARYLQGMLDWTIFYGPYWATLEIKGSIDADERPNQRYYMEKMNEMSFSAFVYPENEEEVLRDLQLTFSGRRQACVSQS